jgi:secreted PhoX family phosphatase
LNTYRERKIVMSKFEKKIGRRDFLKGAGATAAGVAAVSVLGGMAFAAEDEVDAVTSASSVAGDQAAEETVLVSGGTKYTTYANTDQIGTLQPNAAQERRTPWWWAPVSAA